MDGDRTLSVGELAGLSGVTVRTLHHYDEIGLLSPTGRSVSGYRQYSRSDAERLAQILAYRAGGLSLAEIATALLSSGTPLVEHLRRQVDLLDARAVVLAEQRAVVIRALEAVEMGINLEPEELLEVFGDHDPREYTHEAEERWGETDSYRESHRRTTGYGKDDWLRIGAESEAIEEELADCLAAGLPAESARATAAAEAHRLHIDRWFYPCSYEMHSGLADMYAADPRFAQHYDERLHGLAHYVRDAILANAIGHIA